MNKKILLALLPLFLLMGILFFNVQMFKDLATSGPNQLALIFSALFTGVLAVVLKKCSYKELEEGIFKTLSFSLQPCLILVLVGALISSWIFAGIVPSMIYYGLKILHPHYFLPLCCLVCCVASTATGSSWSTGGTLGVAFMGIGKVLGYPPEIVAGAVISGAYFGDKVSPLSDTTNLAAAISGTPLFDHVKHLFYTTIPALVISLIIFLFLGMGGTGASVEETTKVFIVGLEQSFHLSGFLLLPPLFVMLLVLKKAPAIPSLVLGVLMGIAFAFIFQTGLIQELAGNSFYEKILFVLYAGFKHDLNNQVLNDLLHQGGITSMFDTIFLISAAMSFGGAMEASGFLKTIATGIVKLISGVGQLIGATLSSAVLLNASTCDQYLTLVVTGEMFKDAYKQRGIESKYLSRCLEDGGTATSVLIPWNTCGAYFATLLGVSTLSYLPYCYFNLLCPFISLFVSTISLNRQGFGDNGKNEDLTHNTGLSS